MALLRSIGVLAFKLPKSFSYRETGIKLNGINAVTVRGLIATVKHQSKKDKPIADTTIMVQDGTTIHEMPCIVRIVNGEFKVHHGGKTATGKFEGMGLESCHPAKAVFKGIDSEDETEMILGFKRCNSAQEIFQLLDVCPQSEVTPSVALAVMKRIFDFENSDKFINNNEPDEISFTFTRNALMKQLIETVCASNEPQVVVESLRAISRDTNKDRLSYMDVLATETIIQVTDGKFNINQVCDIIRAFYNLGSFGNRFIDKVWVGINEKHSEINVEEICNIISILPLLKTSRKYLYNIVERKFPLVWHKLEAENIIRIFQVLVELKLYSSRLLNLLTRWTILNIHTLSEGNLRWIVYSLMSLDYTDDSIQQALSRYMKIKRLKINDSSLVAVVLDYCRKLRIRHPTILDAAADYYVIHSDKLSAPQITSFIQTYGNLNYTPKNDFNFFHTLESQIEQKFSEFSPIGILQVLLSCIYLERYPLNFVKRIFNPYFFDQIHALKDEELHKGQKYLKNIDIALTLEASNYSGPILPKFFYQRFWRDGRILRCMNGLSNTLLEIAGSSERFSTGSALLPELGPLRLYLVDCIIDMSGRNDGRSTFKWPKNSFALIIHLPEHFDITGTYLTGPQTMKRRQLQLLKYNVVGLNYMTLAKLLVFPCELKTFIENEMKASIEVEPYKRRG